MKKNWPITILLCLLLLGGGGIVLLWPRTVPLEQCSEIYQKYVNEENVRVSFIKGFRVNDSVFVDVTLLEATDSAGWSILKKDFEVPALPLELQQLIDNGEDLIFTKSIPKSEIDALGVPNDLLAISHLTYTLTVFHIGNATEKHAIMRQNYKRTIYQ